MVDKSLSFKFQMQTFLGGIIKNSESMIFLLLDVLSLLSHIPRLSPESTSLVSLILKDNDGKDVTLR